MNLPLPQCRPALMPGCRLGEHPTLGQVLLVPEGMLRVNETGIKVLESCDGVRTFAEIVALLRQQYPAKAAETIENEVGAFLERLRLKRVADY
ncbi:MAG TPA: pyrroloquinoline quinone biosynthesis peptide chaperone PqqD [Candidatus Saccharimonadales bacterium]|jgi:pyrroloquinoline quinone biosynthesis protein D|nr:pyrroloquinoline quinone biosynthesis peptide chaperone PqqD [Candidatus Saccharimonadales bacterium]